MPTYTVIFTMPDQDNPCAIKPGWIETPMFHEMDEAVKWFDSNRERLCIPADACIDSIRRNKRNVAKRQIPI